MRTFAMMSLNGTDDVFSRIWEHNFRYYARPTDNKVIILQWDLDRAFQISTGGSVPPDRNSVVKLFSIPQYRRLFDGHLHDLIETTFNSTYLTSWATEFTQATGDNFGGLPGYLTNRANSVASTLPAPLTFQVTTNSGNDFSESDSVVTLAGRGWIDVFSIKVNGAPVALSWTTANKWRIDVPLDLGPNLLTLSAHNYRGALVGTDQITVTNTSAIGLANAGNLIISEFHYHPSTPSLAEIAAGYADQDLFEFIELANISTIHLDLGQCKFTDGVSFTFFSGTILAPGERLIVVSNQAAFEFRYGAAIATIAGEFLGNLRNSGEHILLEAADTTPIVDFSYGDALPWPDGADGSGYSLVFAGGDPKQPFSWRMSTSLQGNPGRNDSLPFSGDPADLLSYVFATEPSGQIAGELFQLSFDQILAADQVAVVIEFSVDLITWTPATSDQLVSLLNQGDGTVTHIWQSPLPVSSAPRQFARAVLQAR
jgi:hypothetical protein